MVTRGSWEVPALFREMQALGRVPEDEMWRTFNMGIGMAAVVRAESADSALRLLPGASVIGRLEAGRPGVRFE